MWNTAHMSLNIYVSLWSNDVRRNGWCWRKYWSMRTSNHILCCWSTVRHQLIRWYSLFLLVNSAFRFDCASSRFVLLFWNSDEFSFAAGLFNVCKWASRSKVTFYHIFHKALFGDVFVFILSLFFFRWSAGLWDSELRYSRCTSIENDDAYFLIFALI